MSKTAEPEASVTVQEQPDGWELTLCGEFDIGNVQTLEEALDPLIAKRPDARFALDMGGVSFMDSATLAVLLRAVANGAAVRLRNPSSVIQAVLRASGLESVLIVEND